MMKIEGRYRVTWSIDSVLPVKNTVHSYPTFGVTMRYDKDERGQTVLRSVVHELAWAGDMDGRDVPRDSIARSSGEALAALWDYLKYLSVVPVERGSPKVVPIPPTQRLPVVKRLSLRTALLRNVPMPAPDFFAAPRDPRVFDWLRLANDAAASSSDANAIRFYYMVIEEQGPVAPDIEHARHLVTHGSVDPGRRTAKHLRRVIGKKVTRYDPLDPDQATYLAGVRAAAKAEVEKLLATHLPAYRR